MKIQLVEKEKTVASLQRMASEQRPLAAGGEIVSQSVPTLAAPPRIEDEATRAEREEMEAMHESLRRIAQEVISDADQAALDDTGEPELSTSMLRSTSPFRSHSPARRSTSPRRGASPRRQGSPARVPGFADSTFAAVQAALNKRQLQVEA